MNDIQFGILGCGSISDTHALAISQVPGARVTAAAARTPEKGAAFSRKWNCAPCASYDELLARRDVDAVVIGTPSGQHAEQGRG
ncbi:MAG: Gfo/Idh/MocA family oxidoreductase, partial [bacterium]